MSWCLLCNVLNVEYEAHRATPEHVAAEVADGRRQWKVVIYRALPATVPVLLKRLELPAEDAPSLEELLAEMATAGDAKRGPRGRWERA